MTFHSQPRNFHHLLNFHQLNNSHIQEGPALDKILFDNNSKAVEQTFSAIQMEWGIEWEYLQVLIEHVAGSYIMVFTGCKPKENKFHYIALFIHEKLTFTVLATLFICKFFLNSCMVGI